MEIGEPTIDRRMSAVNFSSPTYRVAVQYFLFFIFYFFVVVVERVRMLSVAG